MSYTKDKLSNIHGKLFEVIRGVEGDCLVLGDENSGDRISGPKPWGGGRVVKQFRVDEEYGPIEYLEAENAKLRKLVADMFEYAANREMELCNACTEADGDYADCAACDQYDGACGIAKKRFEELYADRIRELGIEVPE